MDASRHGFSSMHEAVVVMNTRERERAGQGLQCDVRGARRQERDTSQQTGSMEKLGPHFAHLDSATCRRLTMPPQRCGGRVSSEGRGRRSTGQADTGCGETPEYVWQRSNMLDILRKVSNTTKPKTCVPRVTAGHRKKYFPPGFARNSLKPRSHNFVHLA